VSWLGHDSKLLLVRAWHAVFDGTRICRCARSRRWLVSLREWETTSSGAEYPRGRG